MCCSCVCGTDDHVSRQLLSVRGSEPRRLFKLKRLKKAAKKVGKKISDTGNAIGDTIEDGVDWTTEVGADVVNEAKSLANLFDGTLIPRSQDFINQLISDMQDGSTGSWQVLLQGFGSFDAYVDGQLVEDLEWLGDAIQSAWLEGFCTIPGATDALVGICSAALNAATCGATDAMAPRCNSSPPLLLAVTELVGDTIMQTAITCTGYQVLKRTMCNGIAMSVAELLSSVADDPYSQACNAAVACSCGTCSFTCGYSINTACTTDAWKDAIKEIADAVADIAS